MEVGVLFVLFVLFVSTGMNDMTVTLVGTLSGVSLADVDAANLWAAA